MATSVTPMRKFINATDQVVHESLIGLAAAHSDLLRYDASAHIVVRVDAPVKGKVGIISGGGSGHEPLHGGFVGRGMLDAACPGEVFTSPVPDQMLAATRAVDGGAGVIHIVKNYTGDVMNFKMAAEEAADDGLNVEIRAHRRRRRGQGLAVHRGTSRGRGHACWRRRSPVPRRSGAADLAAVAAGRLARSTPRPAPSASRCPHAPHPLRVSRSSTFPPGRWRSASASTVSPAGAVRTIGSAGDIAAIMVEAVVSDLRSGDRHAGAGVRQRHGRHPGDRAVPALRRDRPPRCATPASSRCATWWAATSPRWRWPAPRSPCSPSTTS